MSASYKLKEKPGSENPLPDKVKLTTNPMLPVFAALVGLILWMVNV